MSSPASPVESRLCLFCGRPIPSGARATGMNAASAGRLLGHPPADSLALTGPTGDRRWFAHPSCASDAGQTRRRSRRAMLDSAYERALTKPLDSMAREELAKTLGLLEAKLVSSWDSLPDDVVDRAVDKPYLDSLIRDGEEPEGALRYSVRSGQSVTISTSSAACRSCGRFCISRRKWLRGRFCATSRRPGTRSVNGAADKPSRFQWTASAAS